MKNPPRHQIYTAVHNPQNVVGHVVNYTKQFITRTNRHQMVFSTLEQQVAVDNPVRLVDAFVDTLELQKIGFANTVHKSEVRVRISKIGGKQLCHILYMAALNAKKTIAACKALYDRLVEKGENKKGAIIAVCSKLLSRYLRWYSQVCCTKTITSKKWLKSLVFYTVRVMCRFYFVKYQ